jgi:hypothetical protein
MVEQIIEDIKSELVTNLRQVVRTELKLIVAEKAFKK